MRSASVFGHKYASKTWDGNKATVKRNPESGTVDSGNLRSVNLLLFIHTEIVQRYPRHLYRAEKCYTKPMRCLWHRHIGLCNHVFWKSGCDPGYSQREVGIWEGERKGGADDLHRWCNLRDSLKN